MTEVRTAVPADAYAVARVHLRSWRWAYPGLIDQDYLDKLTPEVFTARYTFGRIGVQLPTTLVAVDGLTVRGFATTGLSRHPDLPNYGELMAIYVDPAHAGTGIGRLLITAARGRLRRVGVMHASLWVLDGNVRARRFYERDGWCFDGTRRREIIGASAVDEVRYRRTLV
ncbi:GNAT family N-acetyltransferase [Mycobacterium simiae]|uniref:GNAT family N-acetyltransferase n=2 Tax=Mycobacterium simiae TaxID=1784 RepID=A0A5B1BXK8_MYCSI|nr:GNAT family N-acetyltransferase [Mycobacterium simiae]